MRVAILIFDNVEVLDCCGPFEVFATTKDEQGSAIFPTFMVAKTRSAITAVGGLRIEPHYSLADCPAADVLVIPGGVGRKEAMHDPEVLEFVRERGPVAKVLLSVCTGAFIVGKAGLLEGLRVTTHHSAWDELAEAFPSVTVEEGARFVDNGQIVTAAGIAAGIDASLHVVSRLCGEQIAAATARRMEYHWP